MRALVVFDHVGVAVVVAIQLRDHHRFDGLDVEGEEGLLADGDVVVLECAGLGLSEDLTDREEVAHREVDLFGEGGCRFEGEGLLSPANLKGALDHVCEL